MGIEMPLRGEALRRMAWPYVQRMVKEGLSANRIQESLREVGLGYRRQDLLRDVRMIKSGVSVWETMPRPPAGTPLDLSETPVREVKIPTEFQINLVVERIQRIEIEPGKWRIERDFLVRSVQTDRETVLPEEIERDLIARLYAEMYPEEAARTELRVVRWFAPWRRAAVWGD